MKRKSRIVKDRPGYIYIMQRQQSEQHKYKIGLTKHDPELRAKALSRTALETAEAFLVIDQFEVKDRYTAEAYIHQMLQDYRTDEGREFFIHEDLDFFKKNIVYVIDLVNNTPFHQKLFTPQDF